MEDLEKLINQVMPSIGGDHLAVVDSRTGATYKIPVEHNSISAASLAQIKAKGSRRVDNVHVGLRVYDNGYNHTAVMKSKVTFVDGQRGSIQYHGYYVEDLIGRYSFLDTAYLLHHGHLPSETESNDWNDRVSSAACDYQVVRDVIQSFEPTAHPVTMGLAGLAALVSTKPETMPIVLGQNVYFHDKERLDSDLPAILMDNAAGAAIIYCHAYNRPFTPPTRGLPLAENFLRMIGLVDPHTKAPSPQHVNALETVWILSADHEMTASSSAFLHVASTLTDPVTCLIAALTAGSGILHAGAIEVVLSQFTSIGHVTHVRDYIERVKSKEIRLMGYGHRVYKTPDPRAGIIKALLLDLVSSGDTSGTSLVEIALEVDRVASQDEYFTSRGLHCNADLYTSLVYSAIGIEPKFHLLVSCIARAAGLLAHFREAMLQPVPRIWRPQQIYVGPYTEEQNRQTSVL